LPQTASASGQGAGGSIEASAATGKKAAKGKFDAGWLFVGAQFAGNFTVHDQASTSGKLGLGGMLMVEYVIIPYLKVGLEPGYATASYTNSEVTDKDANIVDDDLNLYVDPEDKITKRGGRGTVRGDAVTLPIVFKGRYPIAVGKKDMFLAPYLSLGGQLDFNLTGSYAVQNDDTFDWEQGRKGVDFKLLGGLGLDFSLGKFGQIGLEGRYLFGITKGPATEIILNSRPNSSTDSEFPIDFRVPENRWSQVQMLLNYRYGFALGR
jgi:hypothetical protein